MGQVAVWGNAECIAGKTLNLQPSQPSTLNLAPLAPGPQPSALSPSSGPIQLVGRTTCDRIVVFEGNPRLAGTFAKIEVTDCTQTTLLGEIVTQEVQHGSFPGLSILV